MDSILNYNDALNAYDSAPSATTYNNVLNDIPSNLNSNQTTSNGGGQTSGASGNNPVSSASNSDDPMSEVEQQISAYNSALATYNSKASSYYSANPFNFDDFLNQATSEAEASVDPYYQQLLSQFTTGINQQRSLSLDQENQALNNIQADVNVFQGQSKAALQQALTQAGTQYSDMGSYDSGAAQRALGNQSVQNAYNLQNENINANYQTQQQTLQGNYFRNQYLPLQTQNENIELGNQQQNAVNQQAALDYQANVANYNYNAQSAIGAPPGENATQFSNQIATLLPYVNQQIPSSQLT